VAIDVRGVCTLVLVFDMPTSLKFYRDALGFEVVGTSDDDAGDNVVDSAYRHLRAKGIAVKEPTVAAYGMKQLYVLDPDGYNLCFQWEATRSEQPAP
jgi:catechol 2,3-dioxygenase-like lactoylglutathione lyase family enzyme